jgi:hypothetical protein
MAIVVDAKQGAVAPAPSSLFSARDIAELALQKIGAFTVNDEAADPVELDRALEHMEIEIAELAGTERCQWLVPATVKLELAPGVAEYDLLDQLGSEAPSLMIAYVIEARLVDAGGNERPLELIRRSAYEEIPNKTAAGTPQKIHVDRLNDRPRLLVYPVPRDADGDGEAEESIKLTVQTYAPSVLGAETHETAGVIAHGLDRAWQKWLVNATALAIGDGPVRQLDAGKLNRLRALTEASRAALLAYQNREKISMRLRRTRAWWR